MSSRICVYCGSRSGRQPQYEEAARRMGLALAGAGFELVYGGGAVGLMGAVANAAMEAGGHVIGVIPQDLFDLEAGHTGISTLHVTANMHERKMKMAVLSDAFVAMPGGWGTLEELAEVLTWSQLRFHRKPIALLNVAGYYDPLLAFFDHVQEEGFLGEGHRDQILVSQEPERLVDRIAQALRRDPDEAP